MGGNISAATKSAADSDKPCSHQSVPDGSSFPSFFHLYLFFPLAVLSHCVTSRNFGHISPLPC